jgi:hypothetical protein
MVDKEVQRRSDMGLEVENNQRFKVEKWTLPSHIIDFLSSKIPKLTEIDLSLVAWPEFKKTINAVIDHRIEQAAEINGAINTTYLSLDEHLVVYWASYFL